MPILRGGALYFALVFGAGFVLGTGRVLWLVPRFGTRVAELMETPVMLVVRRMNPKAAVFGRLGLGLTALALMLVAEFIVVLRLRGLSMEEYLASRDLVSGSVYYIMLGMFALMPVLVARGRGGTGNEQ